MEQNVVLCGANSYDQKYYLNQEFSALPDAVKQELQIMCVRGKCSWYHRPTQLPFRCLYHSSSCFSWWKTVLLHAEQTA